MLHLTIPQALAFATMALAFASCILDITGPRVTYRKVGGLHFLSIGRLGGSVYVARRSTGAR